MTFDQLILLIHEKSRTQNRSAIRTSLLREGWTIEEITEGMKHAFPTHPLLRWINRKKLFVLLLVGIGVCGIAMYSWHASIHIADIRTISFATPSGWIPFNSRKATEPFKLLYPPGWRIQDSNDSVVIHGPDLALVTVNEEPAHHGLAQAYAHYQELEKQKQLKIISQRIYRLVSFPVDEIVVTTEPAEHSPALYMVNSEMLINNTLFHLLLTFPSTTHRSLELQTIYLQILQSFTPSPLSSPKIPPVKALRL